MTTSLERASSTLYETDYNIWIAETVEQLKKHNFDSVDWQNLIEEVSDLSRRERRKLKNLLRNLWEHLLKLTYWQSEIERNQFHWKGEIRNFRKQIQDTLKDSPSLRNYLNTIHEECYQDAREIVSDKSQLPLNHFPQTLRVTLEQVLNENWFLL